MSKRLKIVLVGEESAAIHTLRMLRRCDHEIVGVVSSPEQNSGTAGLWTAAERAGLCRWPSVSVKRAEFAVELERLSVDLLLNVHALHLIHEAVLNVPTLGAYNLHPGPLPEYAGLNVPSWAILNGEYEHAVTLHRMVPRLDAGTIAYDSRFPVAPDETGLSLMLKCVRNGLPLIQQLLEAAAIDAIPCHQQDFTRRRYFNRKPPHVKGFDWDRSAARIEAHLRACDYGPFPSPWGWPVVCHRDGQIAIQKVEIADRLAAFTPGTVEGVTEQEMLVATRDRVVQLTRFERLGPRQPLDALVGQQLTAPVGVAHSAAK